MDEFVVRYWVRTAEPTFSKGIEFREWRGLVQSGHCHCFGNTRSSRRTGDRAEFGLDMAHNRKLVIGCVALTMARVRPAKAVASAGNRVRDELEREIIVSKYLEQAPFRWIGLIIREGLVNGDQPHYGRIDPKDGELPLAIEIDVHRLLGVPEDEMVRVYRTATLTALIHAGEKYKLPIDRFEELFAATKRISTVC